MLALSRAALHIISRALALHSTRHDRVLLIEGVVAAIPKAVQHGKDSLAFSSRVELSKNAHDRLPLTFTVAASRRGYTSTLAEAAVKVAHTLVRAPLDTHHVESHHTSILPLDSGKHSNDRLLLLHGEMLAGSHC